jgi:glycosyl transferase family 25
MVSIYILGLKKRFRGAALQESITEFGFDSKLIEGIDASEARNQEILTQYVDQKKAKFVFGRELALSEVSCALGHLEMYETFLLSGDNWGLFLEDDVVVLPKLFTLLRQIREIPSPTLLTLANPKDYSNGSYPFPFYNDNLEIYSLAEFYRCAVPPVAAYAYLMNRRGAEISTHSLRGRKVYCPADFPFEMRNRVSMYASGSEFVSLSSVESLIENSRKDFYQPEGSRLRRITLRRLRVIFDYTGIAIIKTRSLGIPIKFYFRERVIQRQLRKNVLKNHSIKFLN